MDTLTLAAAYLWLDQRDRAKAAEQKLIATRRELEEARWKAERAKRERREQALPVPCYEADEPKPRAASGLIGDWEFPFFRNRCLCVQRLTRLLRMKLKECLQKCILRVSAHRPSKRRRIPSASKTQRA